VLLGLFAIARALQGRLWCPLDARRAGRHPAPERRNPRVCGGFVEADDGSRTRDLRLGKSLRTSGGVASCC